MVWLYFIITSLSGGKSLPAQRLSHQKSQNRHHRLSKSTEKREVKWLHGTAGFGENKGESEEKSWRRTEPILQTCS